MGSGDCLRQREEYSQITENQREYRKIRNRNSNPNGQSSFA
jgi:hypothetical protein